jgi:hypothetical protein
MFCRSLNAKCQVQYRKRNLFLVAVIAVAFTSYASAGTACLKPPRVIEAPNENHALITRKFQGIPSLAISPKGRLWATWYAGKTPGEDQNNYVVVATSGNNGRTWTECHYIDPDGEGQVRAFDPELWLDPTGRLWSFWAQAIGTDAFGLPVAIHDGTIAGVWAMTCDDPDKEEPQWSAPKRLTDGIMMCKPTVLSTGEWILPASTWRNTDNSARVVVSTDKGRTWAVRGACHVPKSDREVDEHMIVERTDRSLWMLLRTKDGIGESVSKDRGKTWSAMKNSAIRHPSARFFIRRLHSGNLLLVKHGPIDEKIGRSHLTAYLSEDDGSTWSNGLLLDERKDVSYPDGQQCPDGTIHIIYDYSRTGDREILMAKFTENDVIADRPASANLSLRMVVSKYPTEKIKSRQKDRKNTNSG